MWSDDAGTIRLVLHVKQMLNGIMSPHLPAQYAADSFRRIVINKFTFVAFLWLALVAASLVALSHGNIEATKALICAQIAIVPGAIGNAIFELHRIRNDKEVDEWQNARELAPLCISFAVAGLVYFLL